MNPAIYINPEGIVCHMPECPEEPKCYHELSLSHSICDTMTEGNCSCVRYSKALAAAKQSAVPYEDQNNLKIVHGYAFPADTIHPFPEGYKVEIKENYYGGIANWHKVAVLSPVKSKQKELLVEIMKEDEKYGMYEAVESQEELWNDVLLITDDPHRNYEDDDSLIRNLQSNFHITRKESVKNK